MMHILQIINKILEKEGETELAYQYGQQMENQPHLSNNRPIVTGVFLKVLVFMRHLMMKLSFRSLPSGIKKVDYLVYAGTSNQMNSLEPTLQALQERDLEYLAVVEKKQINNKFRKKSCHSLKFSPKDVVMAILLLFLRGKKLHSLLVHRHHPLSITWHFDKFCQPYVYLPYYLGLLTSYEPMFVIVSNDHSMPNRCLMAAARYLGIKTVYLQHASVSQFFPALRFDYAFLDGQASFECYLKCETNFPAEKLGYSIPTIFLSGQKKHLQKVSEEISRPYVGLAVNSLDPYEMIIQTVKNLTNHRIRLKLRWHPGQRQKDIELLKTELKGCKNLSLSDPNKEYVGNFLGQCHTLIAGNSSIHLEAALMGVKPVYFELIDSELSDYYGYVASGLSEQVKDMQHLLFILKSVDGIKTVRPEASSIRHYSASYGTLWEGREGELTGETLIRLTKGIALDSLYEKQGENEKFKSIYTLKGC